MALKILLADDSMNPQNMGKKILSDAGYEVVVVSNGAAAIKKMKETKPDIAVLDVFMPGYTGVEVCEKIRSAEDKVTAAMPVLLTIGKMEMGGYNVADGNKVKADGLVIKPFEASDLLAAVQKLAAKLKPQASAPAPASNRYEKTVIMQRPAVLEEFQDESYAQWKTEAAEEPEPRAAAATQPAPAAAAFAAAIPDEIAAPAAPPATYEDTIRVGPPAGTRESASEIDLDARQSAHDREMLAAAAAATDHMATPTIVVPPQPAAGGEFGVETPSAAPAFDLGPTMESHAPAGEASAAYAVPAFDLGSQPAPAFDAVAHEPAAHEAAAFDPFASASAPPADPFATMISAPVESVATPELPPPSPAADAFAMSQMQPAADPFAMPAADPFATMISAPAISAPAEPVAAPEPPPPPAVEAFIPESAPVEVAQAPGFESHAAASVEATVTPESGLEPTMHAAVPEHAIAPDPAFMSDPHQVANEFSTRFGVTEPEPAPAPEVTVIGGEPEAVAASGYEAAAPAEFEHPAAAVEEHGLTDEHASFEAGISAAPVETAPEPPEVEAAPQVEPEPPAQYSETQYSEAQQSEAQQSEAHDPEVESRLLAEEMHAAVADMPVVGSDTPVEVPAEPRAQAAAASASLTSHVEREVARGIAEAIGAESAAQSPNDRELMVRVVRRVLDQELPTLLYQIMTEYDRERS